MMCRSSGEKSRQVIVLVCPFQLEGCAGHDNNFPLSILIAFVNRVPNISDNGDSEGRNGRVEI